MRPKTGDESRSKMSSLQVTAGGRYICKLKDGSIIGEAHPDS